MRNYVKPTPLCRMLLLILSTIIMLVMFAGCGGKDVKNGIEITPENENYVYSEQIAEYAKNSIYTLLYNAQTSNGEEQISKNDVEKLQSRAEKIEKSLPRSIDQGKYTLLFKTLNAHSEEIVSGFELLKGESPNLGLEKLKKAYFDLTNVASSEYIGDILYYTVLVIFDEKYDAQMKSYEESGKQYMLDKANEYLENKNTFINEVGRENVERLIKYSLFFGDLYCDGAFDGEQIASFTDEEILIFIKSIDLSSLTVSEKGYELILSLYGDLVVINSQKTFFDKIMFKASQNGDTYEMASFLKESISLVGKAQGKLTLEDIQLLREGKSNRVLERAVGRLEKSDWEHFDTVCKQQINKEEYIRLAKEYYGEDFQAYLDTSKSATIDELKDACGKDSFNQTLKEYIFGICPAFSYGMKF